MDDSQMATPKIVSVSEAVELAARLHGDGRLEEAEAVYQKALMGEPDNADALHGLGVLMVQWGQPELSIPLFQKAVASRPEYPAAMNDLGCAYQALGRYDDAVNAYEAAVRLDPAFAEAWNNLGVALAGCGRADEAEEKIRHALRLWPEYGKGHDNLGMLLQQQGRLHEALECYERAVKLDGDPESVENFKTALLLSGDAESFVTRFEQELHQAVEQYQETLATHPQVAEAHNNLGNALKDQQRYDEAISHYKLAAALRSDYTAPLNNWGVALQEMERPAEAIPYYEAALAIKSDDPQLQSNLSAALMELGRVDEALDHLEAAVRLDPDYPEAHYNLALALLNLGRLDEGWKHYLYRGSPKQRAAALPFVAKPLPSDLTGKRFLLSRNQGIGDELFFLRFVPQLKARGAWVAYRAADKIRPLVERLPFLDQVVGRGDNVADVDYALSIGDLPLALGVRDLTQAPSSIRLEVLPEALQRIQVRLDALGAAKPLIGVTWRAGADKRDPETTLSRLPHKEIPMADLAEVLKDCPGSLVALQRNPAAGEIDQLAALLGRPVLDFTDLNDDLDGMLALLSLLAEYVGVSNTNTHLRAALGMASHVLVPAAILDWRWMAGGEHSPWFVSSRIYRQTPEGSWLPARVRLRQVLVQGAGEVGSYDREHPSPVYLPLLDLYRQFHTQGEANFAGLAIYWAAAHIRKLVERFGSSSLLDYGCGKGTQYTAEAITLPGTSSPIPSLKAYWGVASVTCYDPAYEPHSTPPSGSFDGVICTDVLEHCHVDDLPWIVGELFAHARHFVFANVAGYPAAKTLANGDNAHFTQRGADWWRELFFRVGSAYPEVYWEVAVDHVRILDGEKQVYEKVMSKD